MQTSNVKATLSKLVSGNKWFSKIRAALPATVASGVSESGVENRFNSLPAYVGTKEYRAAESEIVVMRTRVEQMANEIRRKIL